MWTRHYITLGTTMMLILVMMMMMMVELVVTQKRSDVCTDFTDDRDHAILRPRISDEYTVDVECNLENLNKTVYVREYYDLKSNRGRITVNKVTGVKDYFMDYDQNNILIVDPAFSKCKADLLLLNQNRFIFGYRLKNENSQIFSPSGALHFSNVNETYVGKTHIRGILVDHWRSCQYIEIINATATVEWYFSRKDEWNIQLAREATAPIRMTAVGKVVDLHQQVHSFNHTYDFFNYQPHVDPSAFEVQDGVYCTDRTDTGNPKPFPQVPSQMMYVSEMIDPNQQMYWMVEEAYDNKAKYTSYRFNTRDDYLTEINKFLEVNDYNTGVSYIMDSSTGSCAKVPIPVATVQNSESAGNNQVRMQTPQEWFMIFGVNYQYAGFTTMRNIPVERWVGTTSALKNYKGTNITIEWYFATNDHITWNDDSTESASKYRTPIGSRVFLPNEDVTTSPQQTNLFFFNTRKAPFTMLDISICFSDTARKTLRFSIPKNMATIIRQNVMQSKQAIQSAISLQTGVSAMRVNNIQLYFNPQNIQVVFNLLAKPPHYNDVVGGRTQNSLEAALNLLNNSFKDNKFSFDFALGENVVKVKPILTSLEDITDVAYKPVPFSSSDTGLYGTGAFVGLAMGMLVLGGVGGGAGGFFFFK